MDNKASGDIRVAIFADTHGIKHTMQDVLINQGPFDFFMHLGDGVQDGAKISEELSIPFHGVRGNEDYGAEQREHYSLTIHQWSCLLFHGDQMDLNPFQSQAIWENHYEEMRRMAMLEKASVVLFGHTHQPLLKKIDDIILCNPGSPTVRFIHPPIPSFAILTAKKTGLEICILEKPANSQWIISASERI